MDTRKYNCVQCDKEIIVPAEGIKVLCKPCQNDRNITQYYYSLS